MNKNNKLEYSIKREKDNNWSKLSPTRPEKYELKISVVIPVYNQLRFLKSMLYSLDRQTYPKELFEIIIADDGSSDGTGDYISKIKNNFRFKLKYVWQEDLGNRYAKSTNNAIKLASGDVILNLDGDTIPSRDCIEKHSIWHHSYKNVVILGRVTTHVMLFGRIPIFRRVDRKHRIETYKKTSYLKFSNNPWSCVSASHFSFKRYHAYKAGLFSEEFIGWGAVDDEFGWRLYKCKLFIIPDVTIVAKHLYHPPHKSKKDRLKNSLLFDKLVSSFNFPKLSICILTHNQETQIEKNLDILVNQELNSKFEIIIIDNNSSNGALKKVRKYEESCPKVIKFYRCFKNISINDFIKLGLEIANGEYVMFLSASANLSSENIIQNLLSKLDKNQNISSINSLQGEEIQISEQELKEDDLAKMFISSYYLVIRRNKLLE